VFECIVPSGRTKFMEYRAAPSETAWQNCYFIRSQVGFVTEGIFDIAMPKK